MGSMRATVPMLADSLASDVVVVVVVVAAALEARVLHPGAFSVIECAHTLNQPNICWRTCLPFSLCFSLAFPP